MLEVSLLGLILGSLTACETPPVTPSPPALIPQALLQPCDEFQSPELETNYDLLIAYLWAVQWGSDCRERHLELGNAVSHNRAPTTK